MIKTKQQILEEIYNEVQQNLAHREIIIESLKDSPDDEVIYTKQEWSRMNGMVEREHTRAMVVKENQEEIARMENKLKVIESMLEKEKKQ